MIVFHESLLDNYPTAKKLVIDEGITILPLALLKLSLDMADFYREQKDSTQLTKWTSIVSASRRFLNTITDEAAGINQDDVERVLKM